MLLVDRSGTVLFATPPCHGLWRRSAGGRQLAELLAGEHFDALVERVDDGAPWSGLLGLTGGEGRVVEVQSAAVEFEWQRDSGIRWVQLSERTADLAEVVQMTAAMSRSDALLDAMPDLLFRISADLRFLDYRDPTARGLGLAPDDFLGKRLHDFLPPELADLIEPNLHEALASDAIVSYTSTYQYDDGLHTFENRVVKSGDDEVVLICRDTTAETRAVERLHEERARLRRIVDYSREFTTISDVEERLVYVSPPVIQVLGYSPEELIGRDAYSLIHPDDAVIVRQSDLVEGAPRRLRLRTRSGDYRVFETVSRALFEDPEIGGLLTHCRDVTDYVEVESELVESLDRLNAIVETAAEGIVTTDGAGIIESVNEATVETFGRDRATLVGQPFVDLLVPKARAKVAALFERAAAGEPGALAMLPPEVQALGPRGETFPMTLSASQVVTGGRRTMTMIISDMSERAAFEHQLQYHATHDALTGLPNRSLFDIDVERGLRRNQDEGTTLAVLFLDLDRFKMVNDSLGHAAGDELLRAVADRLVASIRGDGMVARFGGDEFLILCPALPDVEAAEAVAARALEVLEMPFPLDGEQVFLSASIGISLAGPQASTDAVALVRNADAALYRSKANGRSRITVFRPEMYSHSRELLETETALRDAIERNQLVTHYQPVYSLADRRHVGTEALVRWNHDGRLVGPGEFIPIAEESGLINEIGEWILSDACRQTTEWNTAHPDEPPLHVAVNVSARQFELPDFPARVGRILDGSGIDPELVVLELTETSIVSDDQWTLERLGALRDLGIRLAIDDFGIGYSSLAYLRQLPVDIIKIDRSFTSQLEHDAATVAIVYTITNLAHTLGKTVVAEGVESEAQLEVLTNAGCDLVQGYHFARPSAAEEIAPLLFPGPAGSIEPTGGSAPGDPLSGSSPAVGS